MYYLLILAVVFERLAELVVAQRNARWSFAQGGKEFGRPHYVVMVILHTALLLGCVVEPWALHRPFIPWLGWPMLAVVVASQGLRWWCVKSLGKRWNTRVIVLPHATLVRRGPYRWMRHPNYVAVVAEGFALPLVHTAWLTALVFTLANATLLTVRLRVGVAILSRQRPELAWFPSLAHHLQDASRGHARGCGPLRQVVSRRVAGRVLLVGDAAGYEDALTGEGISLAVKQAAAAVSAIVDDTPASYEAAWHRITRDYRLVTRGLVLASTPRAARRAIVPLCALLPTAFRYGVNILAY